MRQLSDVDLALDRARRAIFAADALLISAGAGMGVDSGLPTFRGNEGFEKSYPGYARLGLDYTTVASAAIFDTDPYLAWGFHGRCLDEYRNTCPHKGFAILRRWAVERPAGHFIYTSNIDGHFQKAGFDARRILECHGSVARLQCTGPCSEDTWLSEDVVPAVDRTGLRATDPLPRCRRCCAVARPNVRYFNDAQWIGRRSAFQSDLFEEWKASVAGRSVVIVECGAGTVVPAARLASDWAILQLNAKLVRINSHEPDVPAGHISLPLSACPALSTLESLIG